MTEKPRLDIMDFFIETAHAQGAAQADPFGFLLPMLVIFAAFYFLLIRPQQKRQKAHTQLVAGLSVGDEVITAGGILGKVTAVSDHYATLKVADDVEIKIQKSTVPAVVPKGTIEAA
jgi:preprotein translocase subunit YajC